MVPLRELREETEGRPGGPAPYASNWVHKASWILMVPSRELREEPEGRPGRPATHASNWAHRHSWILMVPLRESREEPKGRSGGPAPCASNWVYMASWIVMAPSREKCCSDLFCVCHCQSMSLCTQSPGNQHLELLCTKGLFKGLFGHKGLAREDQKEQLHMPPIGFMWLPGSLWSL